MPAQGLASLDAHALARGYRDRRLTPSAAVEACLERIDRFDARLCAMAHVDRQGALEAAHASTLRWRRGEPCGPLDGVPLTVKDNLRVAGMPTRWGTRAWPEAASACDELPVARARQAGLIVLGKTSTPEFALQGCTVSPVTGVTRNPWDPALGPGGSSGGAAVSVAAGYAPLALATDGGGSIRRPAAYTGLAGLKPSDGLVPRAHGLPDLFLGHEVVGGLARTVSDLRLLAEVLAGRALDTAAPTAARILFTPRLGARPVDERLQQMAADAADRLRALGHQVTREGSADWAERVHALWPRLSAAGLAWLFSTPQAWPGDADLEDRLAVCGPATRALVDEGRALKATALFELSQAVRDLRATLAERFRLFDFLLTPATAALPWPAELPHPRRIGHEMTGPRADAVFTPFANAAGLPAVTVPCGLIDGLPVACQLVGPVGSDRPLLALAGQLSAASAWAAPAGGMPALAESGS